MDLVRRRRGRAGGAAAAAVLIEALFLLLAPVTPDTKGLVANLLLNVAGLLAVVACVGTARQAATARPWWLYAAACTSWTVGNVIWTVLALTGTGLPFPSVADVFYLAFTPLAVVALIALPSGSVRTIGRTRVVLDGLTVSAALLALAWEPMIAPALAGSSDPFEMLVATAYPLADVALLAVLVSLVAHGELPERWAAALVGTGLVLFVSADTAFAVLTHAGTYSSGGLVNLGWTVGFLCMAAAALRWRTVESRPPRRTRARWQAHLALAPLGPLVVVGLVRMAETGTVAPGMVLPGLVAFSLVLIHQSLALRENHALSEGLERRVERRTASLRELAYGDPLTGLPNRRRFLEDVESRPEGAQTAGLWLALADLDGFKALNDTLGYVTGDEILREVATRFERAKAPGETVFRLGGDEFALLLCAPDAMGAEASASRYTRCLQEPIDVAGRRLNLSASIGVAPVAFGGSDALRGADLAMTAAKAGGGGRLMRYDEQMRVAAEERLELAADLRAALAVRSLDLAFQPIVDLRTGRVEGAEALARWTHPVRGPVSPATFIPLAEQAGLIVELGDVVLEQACRWAAQWARDSGREVPVWVNLSVRQLESPGFVDAVLRTLARNGLASSCLVLEVTESLFLDPEGPGAAALHALRRHGLRVAVDDFGTGYSSLAYLDRLPVDILKMDQQFVAALTDLDRKPAVTRTIVSLARSLDLTLVAEGIETAEQLRGLRTDRVDLGQGFHLHRPGPPVAVADLLDCRSGRPLVEPVA